MWQLGQKIWNFFIGMATANLSVSPVDADGGVVWQMIQGEGFGNLFYSAGLAVMNLFFLIGFVRQAANLKQSYTLETFVESAIKLVLANALMYHCWNLMSTVLSIATYLTPDAAAFEFEPTTNTLLAELSVVATGMFGAILDFLLGLIYIIVAAICGIMIYMTILSRLYQIWIMATTAPLILSTIAGGSEISRPGYSWIRAFFGKAFEIVIIGLALAIGSMVSRVIRGNVVPTDIGTLLTGFVLEIVTMVMITAAVKGADTFMSKVFSL